jgi:hypothetical protein
MYLLMAEFATNNQVTDSTTVSPFYANFHIYRQLDFELDICTDFRKKPQAQESIAQVFKMNDIVPSERQYAQASITRICQSNLKFHR